MKSNKLLKKISLGIASIALVCPLMLNSIKASANTNENRIIEYNTKYGKGQGSAFKTPIANNPKDIHITQKDSMGFSFTVPGGSDDYRTEKGSPLWNQIINKKSNKFVNKKRKNIKHYKKSSNIKHHSKKSTRNPISKLSWKQVNNTEWVYNALHRRTLFNYLKYNDKNKKDKQQVKQAYQDKGWNIRNQYLIKPQKVYKLMWIKDYDFSHHGESYKNTKQAMNSYSDNEFWQRGRNNTWKVKATKKIKVILVRQSNIATALNRDVGVRYIPKGKVFYTTASGIDGFAWDVKESGIKHKYPIALSGLLNRYNTKLLKKYPRMYIDK